MQNEFYHQNRPSFVLTTFHYLAETHHQKVKLFRTSNKVKEKEKKDIL